MATIYNSDLSKELREGAKLQVTDRMPTELAEKVVPVMEVNPKLLRKCNVVKQNTNSTINSSVTVYSTPSNQDFYLCGFTISFINDATSQATLGNIQCTPFEMNTVTKLGSMGNITGVAAAQTISQDFSRPILLKRSTSITATIEGVAVGTSKTQVTIYGYTIENTTS